MLDMNSERLIPIHECSNQTVRNLGPLFPTTSINDRTITRDNVQLSAAKEGKDTAPSAQSQYEEFGPLRMRPASSSLLRDWSLSLADRILKVRPELSPVSSSLRLYCLWRTLECSCQDIENTLPQHKSNLPAMILTIIDDFDLPYEPEAYEELQKMALLQFEAGVKLENLEEKIQMSYLKQLPPAILSKRIDSLMAFIRGETKAKKWIKALAKKDKGKNSAEPYQDLLPFAMWYAAKASVENIVRLLLQSKSQVAASILKGASRLHPQRKFSKEELEGLAQMADNPPPWVGEQLSKMTVKAEPTSQKSKAKKVAKSKKQHTKALESPAAVSSRPIQDDGEMSTKVDLQSSNNKKQNTILESSGAFSSGSTQNDEEMSTEVDVQSSSHKAHHIVGSLIRRVAMIGKSVVRTVNSVTGSESQFLNTPLSNESLTKQQTPSPITTSSSIQKTKKKVGVATPETTSSLGTAPPTAEGKEKKIHTPSSHDHPKKNRVALTHSKRAEQGTEKKRRAEKTIKAAPSMTIPPESSFASVIAAGSVEARRKKNRDPSHQRKAKETMIKYIRREFGKSMQGKRVAEAGDGGGE